MSGNIDIVEVTEYDNLREQRHRALLAAVPPNGIMLAALYVEISGDVHFLAPPGLNASQITAIHNAVERWALAARRDLPILDHGPFLIRRP